MEPWELMFSSDFRLVLETTVLEADLSSTVTESSKIPLQSWTGSLHGWDTQVQCLSFLVGLLVVEDGPDLEESNLKIEVSLFKWFVHRKLLVNCEKIF